MSPVSIGFMRSKNISMGILRLISSSFRLVSLVGGRTTFLIVMFRGSANQCLGTLIYSISFGVFLGFFWLVFAGFRAFRAFRGRPADAF